MKRGKELTEQLSKSLRTGVGLTESSSVPKTQKVDTVQSQALAVGSEYKKADQIDAVNSLFLMMKAAYPLKYQKAFPTDEAVHSAKMVWVNNLSEFSPRRILLAGKKALDSSRFFPDLSNLREYCKLDYEDMGLKKPLQAYYEACYAPKQTRNYHWSHIAVFLAARETGWFMLRSEEQRVAFPVFERNYEILCNRVLEGENLEESVLKGIEDSRSREASRKAEEAAIRQQRKTMEEQGIDPDNDKAARERLKQALK